MRHSLYLVFKEAKSECFIDSSDIDLRSVRACVISMMRRALLGRPWATRTSRWCGARATPTRSAQASGCGSGGSNGSCVRMVGRHLMPMQMLMKNEVAVGRDLDEIGDRRRAADRDSVRIASPRVRDRRDEREHRDFHRKEPSASASSQTSGHKWVETT